jgi:PKD repeat protein
MTMRRCLGLAVLAVMLSSAFLLPGCMRFDGVVDFEADVLTGSKPLSVQFTLLAQGCIDRCLWSFGDGTFSRERNPVHTYEQAGSYRVILTVTPCRGELASARKDDYITVTSGFGATPIRMWCYMGDDRTYTISRSELVPPFEGQDSGENEVLNHSISVPRDFALLGSVLFWTCRSGLDIWKIFAADVTPGRPDNVLTVVQCEDAPRGLAVDRATLNVYWAENDDSWYISSSSRIMRANIDDWTGIADDTELEVFTSSILEPIEDLAFDDVERDLYWTGYEGRVELRPMAAPKTVDESVIVRKGVDGGSEQTIVSEPGPITDIAIDQEDRKLYWFNAGINEIKRANLNGSGKETIISDVPGVADLAIDEKNRRIVWVSYGHGLANLVSAALDGSDVRYRLQSAQAARYTAIAIGIRPPWTPADLGD